MECTLIESTNNRSSYKIGGLNLKNKFTSNGEMLQYMRTYDYLGLLLDKNRTFILLRERDCCQ